MGMTVTQKILAAHAGLEHVSAGQLIEAKLLPFASHFVTNAAESRNLSFIFALYVHFFKAACTRFNFTRVGILGRIIGFSDFYDILLGGAKRFGYFPAFEIVLHNKSSHHMMIF